MWALSGCRDKAAVSQQEQDPEDKILTPLIIAAKYGDLASVERLLKAGADVNARTPGGSTALHFAAHRDDGLRVVEALLNAHADVNASTPNGYTPLHVAVYWSDVRVVNALIRAHADVNARTKKENITPLLRSIDMAFGKPEITLALIQAGADVNVADSSGYTALWVATTESSDEVVEALLKKGADPNVLLGNARPLDEAMDNQMASKVELLLRYGADPTLVRDKSPKARLFLEKSSGRGH